MMSTRKCVWIYACGVLFNLRLSKGEQYIPFEEFKKMYDDNSIPWDTLEVSNQYLQDNLECHHVKDTVTEFILPLLYPDGEKINETFSKIDRGGGINIGTLADDKGNVIGKYVVNPFLNCKQQDDPSLIDFVQSEVLDPPSSLPSNLYKAWQFADGQPMMLDHRYFHGSLEGGFFIEAGADDGEAGSTTLYFEIKYGWSGLLVEPLADRYNQLRSKNRKAWSAQTCLSPSKTPKTVTFHKSFSSETTVAGIVSDENRGKNNTQEMQCIPLYTLILSLGNPRVDFLSLDIEGAELDVLTTIPWDKVDIRAIAVETQFIGEFHESTDRIKSLLESKGFLYLDTISRDDIFVQMPRPDLMSVHNRKLKYQELHSPKLNALDFLKQTKHHLKVFRACILFNVPLKRLRNHCKEQFPREYFRVKKWSFFPSCLRKTTCPADYQSMVRSLEMEKKGYPWKTYLTDSCRVAAN